MPAPEGEDSIYAQPHSHLVDFRFDERVANVFPDMIRRSVPGYETVIAMLGVFASQLVRPNTRVYDLGCSQGAAGMAMRHHIKAPGVTLVGVDNSSAMIERCRANLAADLASVPVELRCESISDTPITQASLVVLNYTLQFLSLAERQQLIEKIFAGLVSGGGLVLSEKVVLEPEQRQAEFTDWHHEFKRLNGYSDLEISQKRQALENVLVPETIAVHRERLAKAGFESISVWSQCFNFVSFIAIKP